MQLAWTSSELSRAGAAADAVMVPGAVFEPLTQQVVVADAQFQLKAQLPNLVNNSCGHFITIMTHTTTFSCLHAFCVVCTKRKVFSEPRGPIKRQ